MCWGYTKEFIAEIITEKLNRMDFDLEKIAKNRAILMLEKIKKVVGNDDLSDFEAMEEIVNIFEEYGVSADGRHDFS